MREVLGKGLVLGSVTMIRQGGRVLGETIKFVQYSTALDQQIAIGLYRSCLPKQPLLLCCKFLILSSEAKTFILTEKAQEAVQYAL